MSGDRHHGEAVGGDERPHGAEHQHLVGQRVEERAGRVVPCLRASQPSMPSVMQRTIQSSVAAYETRRLGDQQQERQRDEQPDDR